MGVAVQFVVAATAHAQTKLLRFPAINGDRVAFTYAGDIWTAPVTGGTATRITAHPGIEVFAHFSPDGKYIAFTGQYDGDEQVYVVPSTGGIPKQLTYYPARGPLTPRWGWENQVYGWTPDGKKIVFRSSRESWSQGQTRLYTVSMNGGPAEPLPMPEAGAGDLNADGSQVVYSTIFRDFRPEKRYGGGMANDLFLFNVKTSDAKRIAFRDKDGKLYLYSFDDKTVTTVASAVRGQIGDYVWSAKGGYLAFSIRGDNNMGRVFIWSPKDNQLHPVTDGLFNVYNPAWDPDGNYLYFLSDREYAPMGSRVEFNFATNRMTGIFAAALRKNVKHPFPPQSDEVTVEGSREQGAGGATPAEFSIDFDGLSSRITRVPVESDNIGGLSAIKGTLVFGVNPVGYNGRQPERPRQLKLFTLKDRKVTTLIDGVGGWAVSGDGTKIAALSGNQMALYDATPAGANSKKQIVMSGITEDRVPTQAWNQIFHEVWRRYRDYFYVGNMHGFDWAAIGKRYEGWLPYVAHRSDVNYVITEMISDLTVQHTYIEGGDFEMPARVAVALPGTRFALDAASGKYKITKIYQGQNEEAIYRAPLTETGVNVAEGEYLLAIDGKPLRADEDPYALLRGKADRPVQLTVNGKPPSDGARVVTYNPVTSEGDLAYLDWTERNRQMVDKLSGGRLGYLHIPDMGAPGIREFIEWYYPQLNKEGLVVDVRANGGGNVSRQIIERLRRKLLGVNYGRVGNRLGNPYPDGVFIGPMATILDERSSSDGDIFPYMFREAKLGLLIGRRSWGGVVGIGGGVPLIDGGSISVPGSGLASADGKWVIEGYGVDPDISVENDPKSVMAGRDPQLERTVQELMKQLEGKKVKLPPMPAAPVKKP